MFRRKFTITIGIKGSIIALHKGKTILQKIFVRTISDVNRPIIEQLLKNNKKVPIYILLESSETNYKRKVYPYINRFDLKKIIKRDFAKEINKEQDIIYNNIISKNKLLKKWECILIYTPYSDEIKSWINFLLTQENRIVGTYMLSIETIQLVNLLIPKKTIKNQNNITLLITNTKVGECTRQVLFVNNNIIFTRELFYNIESEAFIKEFEQDILIFNEFLKRILPNFSLNSINIVNILPDFMIDKIKYIKNKDLNFINLTNEQVIEKINFVKKKEEIFHYSDNIITNTFASSKKKVLKFTIPYIKILDRLHLIKKCTFSAILVLFFAILSYSAVEYKRLKVFNDKIITLNKVKNQSENKLDEIKKDIFGNSKDHLDIDTIIDFGKINDIFKNNHNISYYLYKQLSFMYGYDTQVKIFNYQLNNLSKSPKKINLKYSIDISGKIINTNGNIDELFEKYDKLSLKTKQILNNYIVKYSDFPNNIDFSKKYYNLDFNLKIKNL